MATLMRRFHTAEQVFKQARRTDLSRAGLRKPFTPRSSLDADLCKKVERDLRWLEAPDHHLIELGADSYPALLAEIYDPPCLLFAAGRIDALATRMPGAGPDLSTAPRPGKVAIVGSRSASRYGLQQARNIAGELSARGIIVVSGLALGIDGAAHEGALETGGVTIGILGTGCDEIYPRRHRRLAENIMASGLLVSEFPLGTWAYPANFPRRNRIVTGMSRATLVVEAALRSGSLISAQLAANEGREVMAVPGLVTNKYARGCHQLLKDGASLVEKGEDVLRELGLAEASPVGNDSVLVRQHLDDTQQCLIESLASGPKPINLLAEETGIELSDLLVSLTGLEILGLVYSDGGNYALSRAG